MNTVRAVTLIVLAYALAAGCAMHSDPDPRQGHALTRALEEGMKP